MSVSTKPNMLKAKAAHPKSEHLKAKNVGTGVWRLSSSGVGRRGFPRRQ